MKKIFIAIFLPVIIGLVVWIYIDYSRPVKFDITLATGENLELTYEDFHDNYIMNNNLEMFYGAKFTFKDSVAEIIDNDNAAIEVNNNQVEKGAVIKFKSGMWLFVSKKNISEYEEKMSLLRKGKKVKVTTYFTEKSNRGSFPTPTLMPYMDFEHLDYDYSKLIIE